jgi:hypothetical protein
MADGYEKFACEPIRRGAVKQPELSKYHLSLRNTGAPPVLWAALKVTSKEWVGAARRTLLPILLRFELELTP